MWGRDSRLRRCNGSAATQKDLCKIVIATIKVNWTTILVYVIKQANHDTPLDWPELFVGANPAHDRSRNHLDDILLPIKVNCTQVVHHLFGRVDFRVS